MNFEIKRQPKQTINTKTCVGNSLVKEVTEVKKFKTTISLKLGKWEKTWVIKGNK
jgi:hypothetical protein